jgi:hypothetical protein
MSRDPASLWICKKKAAHEERLESQQGGVKQSGEATQDPAKLDTEKHNLVTLMKG